MMDKDTAAEMIQAKALGCLDSKERKELNEFLNMGGEFPWKEFGEYQNLSALLPIILEIEIPGASVKDKVAQKIYKAIAELKAKKETEKEIRKTDDDLIYPETTVLGDQILPDEPAEITLPENSTKIIDTSEVLDITEVPVSGDFTVSINEEIKEKIIVPEANAVEIPIGVPDVKSESFPDEFTLNELIEDKAASSDSPSNTVEPVIEEKNQVKKPDTKKTETIKSRYRTLQEEQRRRKPEEEIPLKKEKYVEPLPPSKKNISGIVVDVIIYILLLAAIAFVYLSLSSEIESLKKEIKELKRNTGTIKIVPEIDQIRLS